MLGRLPITVVIPIKALEDFEYSACITTESDAPIDELACGDISQIDHELSLHEDESAELAGFILGRPANPHALDLRGEWSVHHGGVGGMGRGGERSKDENPLPMASTYVNRQARG